MASLNFEEKRHNNDDTITITITIQHSMGVWTRLTFEKHGLRYWAVVLTAFWRSGSSVAYDPLAAASGGLVYGAGVQISFGVDLPQAPARSPLMSSVSGEKAVFFFLFLLSIVQKVSTLEFLLYDFGGCLALIADTHCLKGTTFCFFQY